VFSIARRYSSSKLSLDDLVQEGNLGLIRASQDFDPSVHNTRFSTYAELWIKAFVHRALIANDSLIRIPEHLFLLRKRYRRAIEALGSPAMTGFGAGANEWPSIEQVAKEMGISPRKLKPSRLAAIKRDPRPKVGMDGELVEIGEAMDDCRGPEEEAVDHEDRVLLVTALRRLNPVEAWVIRERYGLHALIPDENDWADPRPRGAGQIASDRAPALPAHRPSWSRAGFHRTYAELGRDCGLSSHRIRQVERVALEKLRGILSPWLAQAFQSGAGCGIGRSDS
jgi:RNA polymerase sigma factor (sigma-70 family)